MKRYLILAATALFVLAACSPAAQSTPTATTAPVDAATAEVTESPMDATQEAAASANTDTAYNGPAWASMAITNARTGETFTLADFAGKTVFIEPMATWCTNCRRQLSTNVRPVFEQADAEQVVFISFSVAENVTPERLAEYADQQGWQWIFAVASTDLVAAITADFGRGVITPPSTPHFLISPTGTLSALHTGFEDSTAIQSQISESAGA